MRCFGFQALTHAGEDDGIDVVNIERDFSLAVGVEFGKALLDFVQARTFEVEFHDELAKAASDEFAARVGVALVAAGPVGNG